MWPCGCVWNIATLPVLHCVCFFSVLSYAGFLYAREESGRIFEFTVKSMVFTAWRSYASMVLGVVILSIHLSVTCMLCDKNKQCTAGTLIPHERTIILVFWHQQWLVGDAPFRLKFVLKLTHPLQKTPILTEFHLWHLNRKRWRKSSIMTNRKLTTGFLHLQS